MPISGDQSLCFVINGRHILVYFAGVFGSVTRSGKQHWSEQAVISSRGHDNVHSLILGQHLSTLTELILTTFL